MAVTSGPSSLVVKQKAKKEATLWRPAWHRPSPNVHGVGTPTFVTRLHLGSLHATACAVARVPRGHARRGTQRFRLPGVPTQWVPSLELPGRTANSQGRTSTGKSYGIHGIRTLHPTYPGVSRESTLPQKDNSPLEVARLQRAVDFARQYEPASLPSPSRSQGDRGHRRRRHSSPARRVKAILARRGGPWTTGDRGRTMDHGPWTMDDGPWTIDGNWGLGIGG